MKSESNILERIVEKAQSGDEKALSWLYDTYAKPMFAICLRMMADKARAEDMLHDAFFQAFHNLSHLKQRQGFGGWVRKIVVNRCISELNTAQWKELENLDQIDPELNVEKEWDKIDMAILAEEIRKLPDGCRQIFHLFVFEDLSHKEIADKLKVSESTSKSQYHRARKLLRSRINLLINGFN